MSDQIIRSIETNRYILISGRKLTYKESVPTVVYITIYQDMAQQTQRLLLTME